MRYVEIGHRGHPQHKLRMEYREEPFQCDGCREVGMGSCYRCGGCQYDLHVQCALPAAALSHPFYASCCFQFVYAPPGDAPRYCNACHKDVSGFLYHCRQCGFDLHPCCAKLPMFLTHRDVKLYLQRKVSSACHRCGRKGGSWSYRSSCKKYSIHVACVKEILVDAWHDFYLNKGSRGRTIPTLNGALLQASHHHRRGRFSKCCQMAAIALQFAISAVLGDPTSLIVGLVASFMSA